MPALGNSEDVAKDHYLQIRDAHFEQAVAEPSVPAATVTKAAQNPAQQPAALGCEGAQAVTSSADNPRDFSGLRNDATPCDRRGLVQMGAEGFEPSKA